jgi:DNA-directed RNA polymerase subunit RPC12/RpoP
MRDDGRRHFRLMVIPPPNAGTRTVFVADSASPQRFLFIRGSSPGWSYDCGDCGTQLLVDVEPSHLQNAVFRCNYCGSYNDTARLLSPQRPQYARREKGGGMASTWRRKNASDTWHFCSNCSNWPTTGYETSYSKPSSGEFCNECQAKRSNNNCS